MMSATIQPTKPQWDYIFSKAKFPAMVAGFGSGKTEAAVKRSILGLLRNPGTDRAFYAPTYDLLRMIAFPRFEQALHDLGLPFRLYKSPINKLELTGYGSIFFRSMDAPQRIIGYEVADSDVDELDTMKPDDAAHAWRQIIARNRQKKPTGEQNTVGVTTTPEGFKFVYQMWKKEPRPGYEIIQAPTESNPYLPEGYVDSLRESYPEHLLAAYLDGEFVNLTAGTVYLNYDRDACMSEEDIRQGEPLFIGCDFNVTKQAATVYVQRRGGQEWHAVDELVNMYDTPEMIRIIHDRYEGHEIYIYPDASGGSRKSVDASLSDIALLEQAGFYVRAKKKNPAVKDRVLAMNKALEAGRVKINANMCKNVAECLEQQTYNDNGEPDKTSGKDHQNDATTYPIVFEMPVVKPVANVDFNFIV
jgi:hypothetical protein